ncbi:hypothetical protein CKAN_01169300 [Cinnamomum micranthum f. kanehirae]|uniref:Uncharacterized protein n=1 Tax=Cinnamomum micranthum f. kanehirae TaxID=337451 RepID=A0A443NWS5_9MAGN|nr:hypothetical protein CKAN_01169300 [Cinnamomum micranthum f. kanehirae]
MLHQQEWSFMVESIWITVLSVSSPSATTKKLDVDEESQPKPPHVGLIVGNSLAEILPLPDTPGGHGRYMA